MPAHAIGHGHLAREDLEAIDHLTGNCQAAGGGAESGFMRAYMGWGGRGVRNL